MSNYEVRTARAVVAVADERVRQIELGYTAEHDDAQGLIHLIEEAHYRLGHLGETSSPESAREEIKQAAAILVAALELIDRQQEAKQ